LAPTDTWPQRTLRPKGRPNSHLALTDTWPQSSFGPNGHLAPTVIRTELTKQIWRYGTYLRA